MDFATRLKEERKRLKLKQKEFAEELGMTVQGIINYEKGARKPSLEYIDALIKKGADIQYIYTGERSESVLTKEEQNILSLYKEAPEAIKQAVQAVLLSGNVAKVSFINNQVLNSNIKIS